MMATTPLVSKTDILAIKLEMIIYDSKNALNKLEPGFYKAGLSFLIPGSVLFKMWLGVILVIVVSSRVDSFHLGQDEEDEVTKMPPMGEEDTTEAAKEWVLS